MGVASIIIDIAVRNRNASGEIDQTASAADKFSQSMGAMVGPATAVVGAIGGVAAASIKYASDAQQAHGGVDAVFKDSASAVHEWAKSSADDVGLAGAEYETMAAGIGGALSGMGTPIGEAADATHDLMLRSADLASVFGGTTAQAADAMTSAFRGEYDGLQRLIPGMSAAAVEAQMLAEKNAGMTFASEEAAKAHAITAVIMDKSADAAGNFAKESDTAAGAQQRATAKFQDTAAALGEQLLPVVTEVMTWFTKVGDWVAQHIPLVTTLGAVIGGLALAVLAINAGLAIYSAAQTAASVASALWATASSIAAGATAAFGAAMAILTSPITLIVLAVVALIAIIVLLVKNWDTVAAVAVACWDAIWAAVSTAVEWIKGAVGTAVEWIKGKWDEFATWIVGIWDTIWAAAETAWQAITDAVGAAVEWIKSAVGAAKDWIVGKWQEFADFMRGLWDGVWRAAETAWNTIKDAALSVFTGIKTALEAFLAYVLGVWENIKRMGTQVWDVIRKAAETAFRLIMIPIDALKKALQWAWDKIQSVVSAAKKIPFIGGLFGGTQAAAAAPAGRYWVPAQTTPSMRGRGVMASRGTKGGGGITINVTGALDPVGTAKQIQRILVAQSRRTGAVTV